jgi:2-oxoglutarate dehydrogenase E2 component (dihydrolipoamide succinyltransferase)
LKFACQRSGESVTEATVATWFKKPGEAVAADEMLCELETDKVTVEVPAPAAGTWARSSPPRARPWASMRCSRRLTEGAAAAAAAAPASAPAAAPAESGGGDSVDVMVPTLGESVTEATVATWFKKAGDTVTQDEMLCELETDKVSVEVPAPASGVLSQILAEEGATVEAGGKLAVIGGSVRSRSARALCRDGPGPGGRGQRWQGHRQRAFGGKADGRKGHRCRQRSGHRPRRAHHEGRRAARGNGPGPAPPPRPARPAAPRAPVAAEDAEREERVKMTRLRQTIAKRLKDAQNTAAMLTTYNEVDMTEVMALRNQYKDLFEKKHGVRLGFMSFFTKACVHALKEVPEVNAEIDGTDIVYKNYVHMGIAAGTPRASWCRSCATSTRRASPRSRRRSARKGRRARDGKLSMAEMQGGTFTISNGGVYGSLMSSPILNPPQSGILGMHKIQERPMVIGGEIKIRPMMYLALSYDHRIVDGKGAVTFLVRVKDALEDPRRLLMDL